MTADPNPEAALRPEAAEAVLLNRVYNVIWGDEHEERSFSDIWEGGLDGYLIWLNARLYEMKRLLKPTGSIYVHCDWHAYHYIKVEMDKIFAGDTLLRTRGPRSSTRSGISTTTGGCSARRGESGSGARARAGAVLDAQHAFPRAGRYRVACRVQDDKGGEGERVIEVNAE